MARVAAFTYTASPLFALRLLRTFAATPASPVPSRNMVAGSGTDAGGGLAIGRPTSLPSPSAPTRWKRTKIEDLSCAAVKL